LLLIKPVDSTPLTKSTPPHTIMSQFNPYVLCSYVVMMKTVMFLNTNSLSPDRTASQPRRQHKHRHENLKLQLLWIHFVRSNCSSQHNFDRPSCKTRYSTPINPRCYSNKFDISTFSGLKQSRRETDHSPPPMHSATYTLQGLQRICSSLWRNRPTQPKAASFMRFLYHTKWHITVGRTPPDERSARRRDLYLTTHNTHKRQTSMPPHGNQTHNPSKRAATDPHLRPLGLLFNVHRGKEDGAWC
jgi:hypothetical protein